ncbi:MAG: SpoIID/LytB domain-containing protein [Bacteroidales bacterium]|nr:SpoIID/LytB domain-containing protein [Bacteroidales bacterium]
MKTLVFLSMVIAPLTLMGQTIQVSLFDNANSRAYTVSVQQGRYLLVCNGEKYGEYKKGSIFYVSQRGDMVEIRDKNSLIGVFPEVSVMHHDKQCVLTVKGINPETLSQLYDDALVFKVADNKLRAINHIDLEKYIAGVIEAEGGIDAPLEYYKAQAVLVRTYTIKNIYKHAEEGFNLCDQVHCQAYKGKSMRNPQIYEATRYTAGQVLVDTDQVLAMAPFHSSCGGQTSQAGIYWQSDLPYLRPVNDPFCLSLRNANWEQRIPLSEWKLFLSASGVTKPENYLNYQSAGREQFFINGKQKLTFRQIREKFGLKSSYFSIEQQGGEIVFKGKGFGHGIGMCQLGAMEMARVGYTYIDILHFYFHPVELRDYREMELHRY